MREAAVPSLRKLSPGPRWLRGCRCHPDSSESGYGPTGASHSPLGRHDGAVRSTRGGSILRPFLIRRKPAWLMEWGTWRLWSQRFLYEHAPLLKAHHVHAEAYLVSRPRERRDSEVEISAFHSWTPHLLSPIASSTFTTESKVPNNSTLFQVTRSDLSQNDSGLILGLSA